MSGYRAVRIGNTFHISSRYNAAWVAEIKASIPPGHRRWDKGTKTWIVSAQYEDVLEQLAITYHWQLPEPPSQPATGSWSAYLASLPQKQIYLALVALYHPDHGGNTHSMQDLNAAWANRGNGGHE